MAPASAAAVLVLRGRLLPAADQRILAAFAAQAGVALERRAHLGARSTP